MTTEEANGNLKITVSPEEYAQLAAADLPSHTKQQAGAALKREIETIMMTRIRTYGTCNATLTVDWHNDSAHSQKGRERGPDSTQD